MQAMVINQFGGPEQLILRDIPTPTPKEGEVLIKVRAFGINRAETQMRAGLWFPPVATVSGIECVGQVEYDPSGSLAHGQTVAAIMGGMAAREMAAMPSIRVCLSRMSFLSKRIWTGQTSQPYPNPTRRRGSVSLPMCT